MSRTLGPLLSRALAAHAAIPVQFLSLEFGGATIRLTSAPFDVDWDGFTWEGIGGFLEVSPVTEGTDDRGGQIMLTASGVDQSLLAALLAEQYMGRPAELWWGWLAVATNELDNSDLIADAVGWNTNLASGARDTAVTKFGSASFRVTTTNASSSGCYVTKRDTTRPPATPDVLKIYRAWIRAGASGHGKTVRFVAHWYDGGGGFLSAALGPDERLEDVWRPISFIASPAASTATTLLAIYTPTAQGVFDFHVEGARVGPDYANDVDQATNGAVINGGSVLATPLRVFSGVMNGGFEVNEEASRQGGTVKIVGRFTHRVASLSQPAGFRTNVESHQAVYRTDQFFEFVPGLENKPIRWGLNTSPWGIGRAAPPVPPHLRRG